MIIFGNLAQIQSGSILHKMSLDPYHVSSQLKMPEMEKRKKKEYEILGLCKVRWVWAFRLAIFILC